MNPPNLALMRRYGTTDVFFSKTAGASPFAARVAASLFAGALVHGAGTEMDKQRAEAHQLNEQFRLAEQRVMGPIDQSLQHAQAPRFVPAGSDLPVGWDEGMVRLASIARSAGADMAKHAALVTAPTRPMVFVHPPSMSGTAASPAAAMTQSAAPSAVNTAATGPKLPTPPARPVATAIPPASSGGMGIKGKLLGAAATLGGGYLALKGVDKGLGWLSRPAPAQQNWGAPGTQLPMGVNQYGQPQPGSPLMG